MNVKQLEILAGQIAKGVRVKRTADQLICIMRLIFYSGLRQSEIFGLEVRDVIDSKDNIVKQIKKLNIVVSGSSEAALRDYLIKPKDRRPYLLKRTAFLFPNYRYTEKLKRGLKAVGTDYIDIIHSGVRHSYQEFMNKGVEWIQAEVKVAENFRYDIKTVQNIIAGKTATAGARDDDRTRIVELSEKASNIKPDDPEALQKAGEIMGKMEMIYKQAEDGEWKDQLDGIIRSTRDMLEQIFSAKQNTNAATPDDKKSKFQAPDLLKLIRSINSNSLIKPINIDDED